MSFKHSKKILQLSRKKLRDDKHKLNYFDKDDDEQVIKQAKTKLTDLPPVLLKIILNYAEHIPSQCPMMEHNFDDIVMIHNELSHDGYDRHGPKSDLYEMYILLKVDGVKYIANWSKEDWYGGSIDEQSFYFDGYHHFSTYMKQIKYCYSMRCVVKKFNKYLHKRRRTPTVTTY